MRRSWSGLGFSTTGKKLSTVNFLLLMNLKIIKYSVSWIGVCVCACVRVCVQTRMSLYLYVRSYRFIFRLYNIVVEIQSFMPLQMWFLFGNSFKRFPSRRRYYLPPLIHNISPAHFVGGLRKLSATCIKAQTVCRARYPTTRKGSEKLQCVFLSAERVPSRLP